MNSKLKLPFLKFLQPLQLWLQKSQAQFWQVMQPVQTWRDGSWLVRDRLVDVVAKRSPRPRKSNQSYLYAPIQLLVHCGDRHFTFPCKDGGA